MGDWAELVLAYVGFLASHVVPMFPRLKAMLISRMGKRLYSVVYGTLSLIFMTWVIVAAGRAPYVEVLDWAEWQLWMPNVIMPVALWLAVSGLFVPNPLSFGGRRNEQFQPDAPRMVGFVRHPLLWALALWSASHMLANPNLAHWLVFGGFALFAVMGMGSIDRRLQRQLGQAEWQRLACKTSNWPRLAAFKSPGSLLSPLILLLVLLIWLALLSLHGPVIGVLPYPSL